MFYLKEALKLRPASYLAFTLWVLSAVAMVGSLGHGPQIQKLVATSSDKVSSMPFFYALIDSDRPFERAVRKLRELPGVSIVSTVASSELEKSLKSTMQAAGLDLKSLVSGPAVSGVKVIFDKGLAHQGQELIRDYLVRLIGEDYITLGAVSVPDSKNFNTQSSFAALKTYLPWIAFMASSLIWFWAFTHLLTQWKERAYVIERFQRRKNVLLKMICSSAIPTFILAFTFNAWLAPVQLMALVTLAVLGLSLSLSLWRGGQWEAS